MEKWYDVEDFKNYKVSNYGNVKRVFYTGEEKMLKQDYKDKHLYVKLYKNGKHHSIKVATLVLKYVLKIEREKYYIEYRDGNSKNCNDYNLMALESNEKPRISLTKDEVIKIYKMTKKMSISDVAKLTNKCTATIFNIKYKKTHKRILSKLK